MEQNLRDGQLGGGGRPNPRRPPPPGYGPDNVVESFRLSIYYGPYVCHFFVPFDVCHFFSKCHNFVNNSRNCTKFEAHGDLGCSFDS